MTSQSRFITGHCHRGVVGGTGKRVHTQECGGNAYRRQVWLQAEGGIRPTDPGPTLEENASGLDQ